MDSPKTGRFPVKLPMRRGKPVAGATVMVDGTSTGTTTGTDGKFTIAAPADATLAVSFIGYETRKVAVAGKTHVEVVMHEDAQAIENVVVTAFGTTTKKDLTGSIATIRGEELAKRQVSTVSKMLEGAVPGVQLTTATNQPGTDAAIYVRGVGSLNAGTGALIVLDGSPYQGSLSDINPADIEVDLRVEGRHGQLALRFARRERCVSSRPSAAAWTIPRSASTRDSVSTPALSPSMTSSPIRANTSRRSGARCATRSGRQAPKREAAIWLPRRSMPRRRCWVHTEITTPSKYSSTYLIDPATGKLDPSARRACTASACRTNSSRPDSATDERFGQRREREVRLFHLAGLPQGRILCDRIGFERYSARVNVNTKLRTWIKVGANLSYAHTVQNNILEGSSLASSAFATARSWEPVFRSTPAMPRGKIKV